MRCVINNMMKNPWETINLEDYENHMACDTVRQLQVLNEIMKAQLSDYSVSSVIILGIAGGNGLEHINEKKYAKVYGIDINGDYINSVNQRYKSTLSHCLECIKLDLLSEAECLPKSEFVIANLLIEYIGYTALKRAILHINPIYFSCAIQKNVREESWVSDTTYTHVFDELETIHHQIDEDSLEDVMLEIGYKKIKQTDYVLPNGKKLIQMDFKHFV